MRQPPILCISLQTTAKRRPGGQLSTAVRDTYWVADVCGRNDPGVEEYGEELNDRVEVEEHEDFLAAWTVMNMCAASPSMQR